jgi:hypothetical protein
MYKSEINSKNYREPGAMPLPVTLLWSCLNTELYRVRYIKEDIKIKWQHNSTDVSFKYSNNGRKGAI